MWVFSFEAFLLLLLFGWGESWLLLSTVGLVYYFCSCGAAQGPENPDRECVLWGAGLAHRAWPCAPSKPCSTSEQWERAVWNQVKKLLWQIQLTRYLKALPPLFFFTAWESWAAHNFIAFYFFFVWKPDYDFGLAFQSRLWIFSEFHTLAFQCFLCIILS